MLKALKQGGSFDLLQDPLSPGLDLSTVLNILAPLPVCARKHSLQHAPHNSACHLLVADKLLPSCKRLNLRRAEDSLHHFSRFCLHHLPYCDLFEPCLETTRQLAMEKHHGSPRSFCLDLLLSARPCLPHCERDTKSFVEPFLQHSASIHFEHSCFSCLAAPGVKPSA